MKELDWFYDAWKRGAAGSQALNREQCKLLEDQGLITWVGTPFGTHMWSITQKGIEEYERRQSADISI